ncbi:type II secretion system F family protein [Candidatus Omnitrophota bacterium]
MFGDLSDKKDKYAEGVNAMELYIVLYYMILVATGVSVYLLTDTTLTATIKPRLRSVVDSDVSVKRVRINFDRMTRPLAPALLPLTKLRYLQNLRRQTDILKIPMNLTTLVFMKLVLAIVAGGCSMMIPPIADYALFAALIGFFIPDLMFFKKVKEKKELINSIFPEVVDLIDLCIGAGLDFTSSMKWVIEKSAANPFTEQLETVLKEIQVGRNRVEALKDMGNRLQLPDISSFVRTVIQSERMGTSVEEAFRNLSEDTRQMRFQNGERYAIKASLKILFPLLFCILPVIMIIVAGPIIIKFTTGELIPKSF